MCSVFIKYMYTCTKPFSNFQNLSGVNGVDICDVTFTAGGGAHYCDNMWPGGGGSEKVKSVVTSLMDSQPLLFFTYT